MTEKERFRCMKNIFCELSESESIAKVNFDTDYLLEDKDYLTEIFKRYLICSKFSNNSSMKNYINPMEIFEEKEIINRNFSSCSSEDNIYFYIGEKEIVKYNLYNYRSLDNGRNCYVSKTSDFNDNFINNNKVLILEHYVDEEDFIRYQELYYSMLYDGFNTDEAYIELQKMMILENKPYIRKRS